MSEPYGADRAWDDNRLGAAFRARSSNATPPLWLVESTVQRLNTQRGADVRPWHRLRLALAPIAVVIVLVVIASSLVGQQSSRVPPSAPEPSSLGSTPRATEVGRPSATDGPNQVFGLDIVSVTDAMAIRDGGADAREIAVRGWYSPVPPAFVFSCPIILERVAPVQFGCGDTLLAITQDPQQRARADGSGVNAPVGPAISPSFEQVDRGPLIDASTNPRACGRNTDCPRGSGSVPIVAIGHFDDRRAGFCKAAVRAQCRDRFVVDRLDKVDDRPVPTSVFDPVNGNHVWRTADVEALVEGDPEARLLSIAVVSGKENTLSIEPSLMSRSIWTGAGAVWIVRQLVDGDVVTVVIVDRTDRVFAIHDDGTLSLVSGSMPASQDDPWPPPDAIVLPFDRGSGLSLVAVVVDLTGHLVAAQRIPRIDPGPIGRPALDRQLRVDRLGDQRIRVTWTGGLCDDRLTLRVRGDEASMPDGLFLDGVQGSPCRAALRVWTIELDFDQPVKPSQFATQYGIGPAQP